MASIKLNDFKFIQSNDMIIVEHKGEHKCNYHRDIILGKEGQDFTLYDGTIVPQYIVDVVVVYFKNMMLLPKYKGGVR